MDSGDDRGKRALSGGLLASFLSAYLAVIEAHLIGWTLYLNADELVWR